MNTETPETEPAPEPAPSRAEQAADWLVELRANPGPETNARFFEWVNASPANLLLILEFCEIERRLKRLSPADLQQIRDVCSVAVENAHKR